MQAVKRASVMLLVSLLRRGTHFQRAQQLPIGDHILHLQVEGFGVNGFSLQVLVYVFISFKESVDFEILWTDVKFKTIQIMIWLPYLAPLSGW